MKSDRVTSRITVIAIGFMNSSSAEPAKTRDSWSPGSCSYSAPTSRCQTAFNSPFVPRETPQCYRRKSSRREVHAELPHDLVDLEVGVVVAVLELVVEAVAAPAEHLEEQAHSAGEPVLHAGSDADVEAL